MLWKSPQLLLTDHVRGVVPGLAGDADVAEHDHGQHDGDHPHDATEASVHRAPIDEQQRAHQAVALPCRRPAGAAVSSPCTQTDYPMPANATIATVGLRVR